MLSRAPRAAGWCEIWFGRVPAPFSPFLVFEWILVIRERVVTARRAEFAVADDEDDDLYS